MKKHFSLKREDSLKQKFGVFFSSLFISASLLPTPAIAETNHDVFQVNLIHDDDSYQGNYNLVSITDYEMRTSIVTTTYMFDYLINHSKGNVIKINGIEYDKEQLLSAKHYVYSDIDDEKILSKDITSELEVDYIYDEDHSGKYGKDKGTYKLISIADYDNNSSVIMPVGMLEQLLENSNDNIVTINGMEFDKKEIETLKSESFDSLENQNSVIKNTKEEDYMTIEYIYDDNHDRSKYALDNGSYKLVALMDYENNNYVISTIDSFNYLVEHSNGDTVKINGIEFDRNKLLEVKEKNDETLEQNETFKLISHIVVLVISIGASAAKLYSKSKKYY